VTRHSALATLAALSLSFASACEEKPVAPPAPVKAPEVAAPAAPAAPQAFVPSQSGKSDPECVGSLDFAPPENVKVGSHTWTLNGYRLTLDVPAGTPVNLGILANLDEPSPENLKAIEAYLAFFKEKGVQAIAIDGDSGDNTEAIQGALTPIAKSGLPVLVQIGNREPKGAFLDAIEALRKTYPNVFNLSRVRETDIGDLKVLSLPGYHDQRYLLAGADGCLYHTDDLKALKAIATKLTGPVVLLSHGPPHGEGAHAIDRVQNPPGNVGDPNLSQFLTDAHIPFGVFANIIEAGGTATNLHGDKTIAPDSWESELYLNPGAADTASWSMNDGSQAKGIAAVLSFKGGKAAYSLLRQGAKTDKPAAPPANPSAKR
jgi:hypothetical protein